LSAPSLVVWLLGICPSTIANKLASTSHNLATKNINAFVQNIIGTTNANPHNDKQELHQTSDE
tara:strand:+ start:1853 stop:2041 length:189 start_codon:yes stop_codon:yes gene_type:complete